MRNSNGNIYEYWEAIDNTFGLQGGFIWDWVDQGMLKEGLDGCKHWAYGGDFGDTPNDLNFFLNVSVWPDRTPDPALNEVKYVYQPVNVLSKDGALKISNTHVFDTTKELEFSWVVHGDGSLLGSGLLPLLVIKPQSSYDIEFISSPWFSLWASSLATEVFLTITVKLSKSTRWAVASLILASTQLQLPAKEEFEPHVIKATGCPIPGKCIGDTIRVSKQDSWEMNINAQTGTPESWKVEGILMMNKGIFLCFWRAPTDNDKGGGETSYASKWRAALLDNLSFHIDSCSIQDVTDYTVKIAVVYLGIRKDQGSTLPVLKDLILLFLKLKLCIQCMVPEM